MKRKADTISAGSSHSSDSQKLTLVFSDEDFIQLQNKVRKRAMEEFCLSNSVPEKKKVAYKSRKSRDKIDNGPNPPPEIPDAFREKIEKLGGDVPKLIIQKGLNCSDMIKNNSRLSMPTHLLKCDKFLSEEELALVDAGKKVCFTIIDPKMKVWDNARIRKWTSNGVYVIAGDWNNVVAANELKVEDVVQIWCFRFGETGPHGFAMVKIQDGVANSSNINSIESTHSVPLNESVMSFEVSRPLSHVMDKKADKKRICHKRNGCNVSSDLYNISGSSSGADVSNCLDFWKLESSKLIMDGKGTRGHQGSNTAVAIADSGMSANSGSSSFISSSSQVDANQSQSSTYFDIWKIESSRNNDSSGDIDLSLHL